MQVVTFEYRNRCGGDLVSWSSEPRPGKANVIVSNIDSVAVEEDAGTICVRQATYYVSAQEAARVLEEWLT